MCGQRDDRGVTRHDKRRGNVTRCGIKLKQEVIETGTMRQDNLEGNVLDPHMRQELVSELESEGLRNVFTVMKMAKFRRIWWVGGVDLMELKLILEHLPSVL